MDRSPLSVTALKLGRLSLADLDPFVSDPAVYERKRKGLTRAVVRRGVALFPGEPESALQPKATASQRHEGAGIPASDLYGTYLREVRSIPTMERSVEFRFALALEICKDALREELTHWKPTREELDAVEAALSSKDATFERFLSEARPLASPNAGRDSARVARHVPRIRQRLEEMLGWKNVLVFRTLPLVPGMARRYKGMGVPVLDLIQEANGSLVKATDRYEWRKGVRFVVYARWWVQQGILKSLSCQSRTVRTPVYMAQKLKKIRDLNDRSLTSTGGKMSAEELGRALDEPVERIQRALEAAKMTVSIDRELDPTGEFMLKDVLVDPHVETVDDGPAPGTLNDRIRELLVELPVRERQVIEWRFGLNERRVETLDEVSHRLGVSRERVRQIQEQAIRRLRSPSKKLHLSAYLPA